MFVTSNMACGRKEDSDLKVIHAPSPTDATVRVIFRTCDSEITLRDRLL